MTHISMNGLKNEITVDFLNKKWISGYRTYITRIYAGTMLNNIRLQ